MSARRRTGGSAKRSRSSINKDDSGAAWKTLFVIFIALHRAKGLPDAATRYLDTKMSLQTNVLLVGSNPFIGAGSKHDRLKRLS
jgi:hypothetical protein